MTLVGRQRGEPLAPVAGTPYGAVAGGHSNGSEDAHGHDGSPPQAGIKTGKPGVGRALSARQPTPGQVQKGRRRSARQDPTRSARSLGIYRGRPPCDSRRNTASQIKRGASALKFSMNSHTNGPWACSAYATFPGFRSACRSWLARFAP